MGDLEHLRAETESTLNKLAQLADLTVDAYMCLTRAVDNVIDHIEPDHRETLLAALEESTMMMNLAASP